MIRGQSVLPSIISEFPLPSGWVIAMVVLDLPRLPLVYPYSFYTELRISAAFNKG